MIGQSLTVGTDRIAPATITAAKVTAYTIRIPDQNSQPMVTIHPDGRLEFGEAYEPDEAARAFWEAVERFAPSPAVQKFGVPLAARIDAALARGSQAERLLRATLVTYEAVHDEWTDSHKFGALPTCLVCADTARIRAFLNEATA
ncbi:hypothetical protein ABZ468_08110 [Streptomyces sp. NPDC005708]|uniref:hypothetical protein n=1 Tax=Streptomyces sp. NPDC005708 TaxID=3154564 RepID=UPI0033F2E53C